MKYLHYVRSITRCYAASAGSEESLYTLARKFELEKTDYDYILVTGSFLLGPCSLFILFLIEKGME